MCMHKHIIGLDSVFAILLPDGAVVGDFLFRPPFFHIANKSLIQKERKEKLLEFQ